MSRKWVSEGINEYIFLSLSSGKIPDLKRWYSADQLANYIELRFLFERNQRFWSAPKYASELNNYCEKTKSLIRFTWEPTDQPNAIAFIVSQRTLFKNMPQKLLVFDLETFEMYHDDTWAPV